VSGFELERPLDNEVDNEATVEKPTTLDLESLQDDLIDAAHSEGGDRVYEAIEQVQIGEARPQELLEWIDDIREFERIQKPGDDHIETGFLQDFQADSVLAAGEIEGPPPYEHFDNESGRPESQAAALGVDDDLYMFSATRRKRGDEDDDGEGEDPAPEVRNEKPEKAKKSKKS
jgi:hypothetical protein